ncbi:MAG: hypothetical protein IJ083_14735 [Clostridia bacterium]|nr:hypothetical protein [Clostridia bacterium]
MGRRTAHIGVADRKTEGDDTAMAVFRPADAATLVSSHHVASTSPGQALPFDLHTLKALIAPRILFTVDGPGGCLFQSAGYRAYMEGCPASL